MNIRYLGVEQSSPRRDFPDKLHAWIKACRKRKERPILLSPTPGNSLHRTVYQKRIPWSASCRGSVAVQRRFCSRQAPPNDGFGSSGARLGQLLFAFGVPPAFQKPWRRQGDLSARPMRPYGAVSMLRKPVMVVRCISVEPIRQNTDLRSVTQPSLFSLPAFLFTSSQRNIIVAVEAKATVG